MPTVLVPRDRLGRWMENFEGRHGSAELSVADGQLVGQAPDGSTFSAHAPFGRSAAEPTVESLLAATSPPEDWGLLLVRKGGFAVARLAGERIVESKVGQRHVQGRTKAGGQSQQRFARRRDNQATAAYEAAADHAARIVSGVPLLVVGGDHAAVTAVLADARLKAAGQHVVGEFLPLPDPRRAVLEAGVADACSARVVVENA